jgi:hypothetical protein
LRITWCLALLAAVIAADGFMQTRLAYSEDKGVWQRISNINKRQESSSIKRTSLDTKANLPRRGPVPCEWAQSAVEGYAFQNVEMKSCYGSFYVLHGTRAGKTFTIVMSANGELLKVEKLQSISLR